MITHSFAFITKKLKRKAEEIDLFSEEDMGQADTQPIPHDNYVKPIVYLKIKIPLRFCRYR
jgi:hypothetical protein